MNNSDFNLSEEELKCLNEAISQKMSRRQKLSPDEDPPDSIEVTFIFTFGIGRSIEVRIEGDVIEVDTE